MEEDKTKGRYFYLMLKENFYDSDDMVLLESMENGYLYSNILLKLYLKSLKDKGKLMYKDRIPYNAEMLSKLTRHNVDVVRRAIEIFKEMGIIEILDNGAIFMLDIENYIGKSSTEADRRRKYDRRIADEKKKLLGCEKSCEKSHEHIDIDIDTNIELNIKDKYITFGEYKRIKLKQKEYDKLIEDYDKDFVDNVITRLDEYVESNNNKNNYKNFNLVIRKAIRNRWFTKEIAKEPTWFNKDIEEEEISNEEKEELQNILSNFR